MAINASRSMNDSLTSGATDGKYKKLRPDTQAQSDDSVVTYNTRRSLSLPYYGVGEARMFEVPGCSTYVPNPCFMPNKFETLEDNPNGAFGQTW